jgi:hypothetical protein
MYPKWLGSVWLSACGLEPMSKGLCRIFEFCGGFAEFMMLLALFASIVLAAVGRLTPSFAGAITAIGGFSIAHDQLSQWNNRKDADDGKVVSGVTQH